MPENGVNPSEVKKNFYLKQFVFYFIIYLAIFLVQRIFVKLSFNDGYLVYWDPYDLLSNPDFNSEWVYTALLPLYLITFFSCAIASVIIDIIYTKSWYYNLILSEIICVFAVLPTIFVILVNKRSPTLSMYDFDDEKETIMLLIFLCIQVGIAIGILVQLLIKKFKKYSQNNYKENKEKGIA